VVNHYCSLLRENLKLVVGMRERVAQGRACGNLGNIYYLLGNFEVAVKYHKEVRNLSLCYQILLLFVSQKCTRYS